MSVRRGWVGGLLGCMCVLGLGLAGGRPGLSREAEPAGPWRAVPGEGVAFLTVHVPTLWEAPAFAVVRQLAEKQDLDTALRENLGLRLAQVERLTFFLPVLPAWGRDAEPAWGVVVTTAQPFSARKVLEALDAVGRHEVPVRRDPLDEPPVKKPLGLLPRGPLAQAVAWRRDEDERDLSGATYFSERHGLAVLLLDERQFLILSNATSPQTVAEYLGLVLRRGSTGRLEPALKRAREDRAAVSGGLDLRPLRRLARGLPLPDPLEGLLAADVLSVQLAAGQGFAWSLQITAPNPEAAAGVERALQEGRDWLKEALPGLLGEVPASARPEWRTLVDSWSAALAGARVSRAGSTVAAELALPALPQVKLLVEHAQAQVRQAAEKAQVQNHFKQVVLAMHNFHDANQHWPLFGYDKAGAIANTQEGTRLSWRVALLPYLEEEELFKQFKLDEPWDSEHNKKLIPKMPKIYAARAKTGLPQGQTLVQAFRGEKGLTPRGTLAQVTDGLSNTIFVAEAGEGIVWTRPDDMPFDPDKPLPKLGGNFGGDFVVGMGDGSVRFVRRAKISDAVLKLLIQPADGSAIADLDW